MAISICNVHTNQSTKEKTKHGKIDFPVACYEDNMQMISVPPHWHEEYEYIIVSQGSITLFINSDKIILRQGESVFINSGCIHSVLSIKEEVGILRSLVFMPKIISESKDSAIWRQVILPLSEKNAPLYLILNDHSDWQRQISAMMLQTWDTIKNEWYDYENEVRYLLSKSLRIMVDHMNTLNYKNAIYNPLLERMKIIFSFIDDNYMLDISNFDLMQLCQCSESVLLRSFRQVVDSSPMQYLLNYRINKAAELLITSDKSSKEVANSCGFHDVSYFTKMFKRSKSMTPIEYRKRYSQK